MAYHTNMHCPECGTILGYDEVTDEYTHVDADCDGIWQNNFIIAELEIVE